MALTAAQLQTLKTAIAADATLNAYPNTPDGAFAIKDILNQVASPDYWVWNTAVAVDDIFDAVTWANYTPADAADGTVQWSNRSLACQGKQFNLQIILQNRTTFNAAKPALRGGLNDATTQLPSGVSGASRSGGWAAILPILRRKAKRIEKIFAVSSTGVGNNGADARGATTNPDVMTFEGEITYQDVDDARNS